MAMIHSAGAVLYTVIDGERRYVLVREKNGSYGMPKGHVEAGERLYETALREVREETGVTARLLSRNPAMVDEYPIAGGDIKRVSWYIAEYADQDPIVDRSQVLGVLVLPIDAALHTLTYGSTREILRKVDLLLG